MSNPKGNVESLPIPKTVWKNRSTKTVRVPVIYADKVLDYAHKLDKGEEEEMRLIKQVAPDIKKAIDIIEDVLNQNTQRFTKDRQKKLDKVQIILDTVLQSFQTVDPINKK